MVVVAVTVDHVFDRRLGDLLDLLDIGLGGRAALADRVGGDHARRGDDEHRLVAAVTKDIDVVGAFDLGGGIRRLPGVCAWAEDAKPQAINASAKPVKPMRNMAPS